MDPGTIIGAATPISGSGADLGETAKAKAMEAMRAEVRTLTERRNPEAQQLALDMIEKAKAVTAKEAKQAELVDFLAADLNDLFRQLDGFKVEMKDGTRVLDTANVQVEELPMSPIEELLTVLTDSSIVFLLGAIGLLLIWLEISSPGGWVAGFAGVVCLALSAYGLGYIPVNWFGIVFIITAFVLFLLDIKALTHGALTTAGVVSFVVGALVLFNTPSTPSFQHVPVPLVVGVGIAFGALFFAIMLLALRVRHAPVLTGEESLVGKTGTAKTSVDEAGGQVQVMSELWSAELVAGSAKIRKGDAVEVVEVKGLRLKVRKK
jgi:membrane-bound serine protease (ClpP class)